MEKKKRNVSILKVLATALLVTGLAFFMTADKAAAGEITIVSINADQVLQAHPAFRQAVGKYQAKHQEMQQKLSEAEDAEQAVLQMQMQQELQQLGQKLQEEATDKMKKDVQQLADENGYDYVIDAGAIIAGTGRDLPDVTLQVIESF